MGVVSLDRGSFESAKFQLQQCHDTRTQAANPDLEEVANVSNNHGNVEFSVLEYDKALTWHKISEKIRMSKGDDWSTSKGMTHLIMRYSYWRLNRKAEVWYRLRSAIAAFEFSGNGYLLSQ